MAQNDPASLAAQFGGVPADAPTASPTPDLAAQFGGTPVSSQDSGAPVAPPTQDFTAAQLPTEGGISIQPANDSIWTVAQRELDKVRQAIRDRTGNAEGNNTAANLMTLPLDAPLRAASGALQSERSEGNRLEGSKEAAMGVMDSEGLAAPIRGVGRAILQSTGAANTADTAASILSRSKSIAQKQIEGFQHLPVPNPKSIQAPLRDNVRNLANAVAQENGIPISPNTPIRDVFDDLGQSLKDKATVVYNQLDRAVGGKFQKYDAAIKKLNQDIDSAVGDSSRVDELEARKAIVHKEQDEAFFRAAKEHGIDPNLATQANKDYRQGSALQDVQAALRTHVEGGRSNIVPDDLGEFKINGARKTINKLIDTGRLQDALGTRYEQMYKDFHDAFTAETNIKDQAKIAMDHNKKVNQRRFVVGSAAASAVGGALGAGHVTRKALEILK